MKFVTCIASHERNVPLGIVLRNLPASWHAVVVLSPGDDPAQLPERPNTHVYHHSNEPLGQKWQTAVDLARRLEPDYLVIQGSDDVLLVDEAL